MKKITEEQQLRGTVLKYTSNKHEDYDGMSVRVNSKTIEVKFPPHTARFIRDIAREGDDVLLVTDEKGHHHKIHLQSIENPKTGKRFDTADVKPPHPAETVHRPAASAC